MTRVPFKRPPLVEVEWVDSMGYPGWRDGNDAVARMDCVDDMRHYTCGYLVKQTSEYVGVALSVGWTGTVGDAVQIPTLSITRYEVVRPQTHT